MLSAVRTSLFVTFLFIFLATFSSVELLQAAPSQAAPPQFSRSQVYGDWLLNCFSVPAGKQDTENCMLRQKLNNAQGQRLVLITILEAKQKNSFQVNVILPLGFHIPSGVTLVVDGGQSFPLKIASCHSVGCQAETVMESKMRRAFTRGKVLSVVMTPGNARSKKVTLPMSLNGISGGLNAIR